MSAKQQKDFFGAVRQLPTNMKVVGIWEVVVQPLPIPI